MTLKVNFPGFLNILPLLSFSINPVSIYVDGVIEPENILKYSVEPGRTD